MSGVAQTSAIRQSLNDRAYNIHIGQGTTEIQTDGRRTKQPFSGTARVNPLSDVSAFT